MSEITRKALRMHNYCMGLQTNAIITALGMHWENKCNLNEGIPPTFREEDFQKIINENSDVLTENGIIGQWQGVE